MSQGITSTSADFRPVRRAVSSREDLVRPSNATRQFCLARATAVARPTPLPAPVITAVRFMRGGSSAKPATVNVKNQKFGGTDATRCLLAFVHPLQHFRR